MTVTVAGAVIGACSSSTTPDVVDASASDSGASSSSGGSSTSSSGSSGAADAHADSATGEGGTTSSGGVGATGCANNTVPCATGLQCCQGRPYPADGRCDTECNLKSDRASKERFANVDAHDVLKKVVDLPLQEWSYIGEHSVRHVGPMAQDFRAAFGLGNGDRSIHAVDANGVTLAAIQALYERVVALEMETKSLREQLHVERLRSIENVRGQG